jgi:hypothetical protein
MMRFGYLAVQAVVPAFLSFVLILAPHPLYPVFSGSKAAIDLRPLNDQQIAGFVSKLTMLIVLITVGGVGLAKSKPSEEEVSLGDPLVWADVKREFERADRRISGRGKGGRPAVDRPRSGTPIGGDSSGSGSGRPHPAEPNEPIEEIPKGDGAQS